MSLVRCVSAFWGLILAKIIPYVTFLTAGTLSLVMNKMVFVPDGIRVPTPCASHPISFANEFSQMSLVGLLIRCLHYSYASVVDSMTTLA